MGFFWCEAEKIKKALNQTFWKRPKCWKVIDSPLLNTPAQNRGKLHTESNWCTKSKMSDRRSKHELPLSYHILHTDSYRLHCEPSMNLTACCCWQPNESSTRQNKWSDLGLHFLPRIGRWFVWITSLPCDSSPPPPKAFMMHSTKDIKRRVCPADHRRRWGDGAWSGWCSASGRSRLHIRLRLQKKTNAHVLELGVAAVKRRRFTKTHATLSDKTCSDGENSSACLSSNTINQSTSH